MKGVKMHCALCGIVEGGHICHEILKPFRGHNICGYCTVYWLRMERVFGKKFDIDKLKEGFTLKESEEVLKWMT